MKRAFSLAELLLAIFILGIGIVAVAALFPAGIAQQRQSADDLIGPIVANNAIALIRTRVRPEHFGTPEEFNSFPSRLDGDFPWRRPAFFTQDTNLGGASVRAGSISIFDRTLPNTTDDGELVPWNTVFFGGTPPTVIIHQRERYYPMASELAFSTDVPRPQYVWDCMFRRFNGKILVAIFVYRASVLGGGSIAFTVPPNGDVPPFPINLDLTDTGPPPWWNGDPWDAGGNSAMIMNTDADTDFDPSVHTEQWQAPGQWMLDQNNTVHRVLAGRRTAADGPVELVRPIPQMADLRAYLFPAGVADTDGDDLADTDVVSNLFFIPTEVQIDADRDGTLDEMRATLTPVYVAVKEL